MREEARVTEALLLLRERIEAVEHRLDTWESLQLLVFLTLIVLAWAGIAWLWLS